jgi:hypothetical protein
LKKDAYFKEQLLKVKTEYYLYQPLHENDFEKPLTPKRKYYAAIIENEAIKYLNNVYTEFNNALSNNEKKYLFNSFNNIISEKFKEVYTQCTKEGYTYNKLLEGMDDTNLEDEVFVIQFLKTELIRIYLEITGRFIEYNTGDVLNEEQIYKHFFKEKQPSPSLFIDAEQIKTASPASEFVEKTKDKEFKPIKNDFRDAAKGILSYDAIIQNPNYFSLFEAELFNRQLINKDYVFNDTHGNKKMMAHIYCSMVYKNYFKKRDFTKLKNITPLDIKKFLNHRYATNIDREFRNIINNKPLIIEFISNNFWLAQLPTI